MRGLPSGVAALALLVNVGLICAGLAVAPTLSPASALANREAAAPKVVTVTSEYGGRPIRFPDSADYLDVEFKGKQGDAPVLIQEGWFLCGDVTILDSEGRKIRRAGLRRTLPHTGRYILRLGRSTNARSGYSSFGFCDKVRLFAMHRIRAQLDGPAVTIPRRKGHRYVVGATVPVGRAAWIHTNRDSLFGHYMPGSSGLRITNYSSPTGLLAEGLPAFLESEGGDSTPPLRAGRIYWFPVKGGSTISLNSAKPIAATYDGPATTVPSDPTSLAMEVTFTASSGDFVRPRFGADGLWGGSDSFFDRVYLMDPAGKVVPEIPVRGLWQVRKTGTYRLIGATFAALPPEYPNLNVAMAGVTEVAPPVVDGPWITVAAEQSDRWAVVHLGDPTAKTKWRVGLLEVANDRVVAHPSAGLDDWHLGATSFPFGAPCPDEDEECSWFTDAAYFGPGRPERQAIFRYGYLVVPFSGGGSIDVRLQRAPKESDRIAHNRGFIRTAR